MSEQSSDTDVRQPSLDRLVRIDRACLAFEDQWRRGERPRIETFLSGDDAEFDASLLRELISLERHYLVAAGDAPAVEAYKSRFPLHAAVVEQVFLSTARRAAVDGSGDDATVKKSLRCPQCRATRLVEQSPAAGEWKCSECNCLFRDFADASTLAAPEAPRTLGRFRLDTILGSGQFGTVWQARDEALDRVVAVKLPRKAHLTPEETQQFLREARTAAQLRHPNIVTIHDVGHDGDTVYIVSDYVAGPTLADLLTAERPDYREAAKLCHTLAEALHYAHEMGVVHRDLKPSNILLARPPELSGGDHDALVPHIADFGLAKRDAGEITMTVAGRVLGTPAYMPPEQARGEGHEADRRSDVYSLGVILFQLLTGELPFRGNVRILLWQILHDEAPSPRKFQPELPRDLETITLKCLEKSPTRRYQTAQALAEELARYLRGEPIQARPVSRVERMVRWARRHPGAAALWTSLAAAILIGFIGVSWQWRRASRYADDATQRAAEAAQNAILANHVVRDFTRVVAQDDLLNVPEMEPLRRQLLEKSLSYYQELARRPAAADWARQEQALAWQHIASIRSTLGEMDGAKSALETAIAMWEVLLAERPHDPELKAQLGQSLEELANCLVPLGERPQAMQHYRRAQSILEEVVADSTLPADDAANHLSLIGTYTNWAQFSLQSGDAGHDAQAALERAAELGDIVVKRWPDDELAPAFAAQAHAALGQLWIARGNAAEGMKERALALQLCTDAVSRHPESLAIAIQRAQMTCYLGQMQRHAGDFPAAEASLRRAVELHSALVEQRSRVPALREQLAFCLDQLGITLLRMSRPQEAVEQFQQAVELRKALLTSAPNVKEVPLQLAISCSCLARAHCMLRDWPATLTASEDAIPRLQQALASNPQFAMAQSELLHARTLRAAALLKLHRYEEALEEANRGTGLFSRLRLSAKPHGDDLRLAAECATTRSAALAALHRPAEAIDACREALPLVDGHPDLVLSLAAAAADCSALVPPPDGKEASGASTLHEVCASTALGILRRAIAAGYNDRAALNSDDSFAALRSLPGFDEAWHTAHVP